MKETGEGTAISALIDEYVNMRMSCDIYGDVIYQAFVCAYSIMRSKKKETFHRMRSTHRRIAGQVVTRRKQLEVLENSSWQVDAKQCYPTRTDLQGTRLVSAEESLHKKGEMLTWNATELGCLGDHVASLS